MSALTDLMQRTGGPEGATPLESAIVEYGRKHAGRADYAAHELAALQARIAELEKVEVAAKVWRHTWVDDEDVREMESGCQCNICNLVRAVEGVK